MCVRVHVRVSLGSMWPMGLCFAPFSLNNPQDSFQFIFLEFYVGPKSRDRAHVICFLVGSTVQSLVTRPLGPKTICTLVMSLSAALTHTVSLKPHRDSQLALLGLHAAEDTGSERLRLPQDCTAHSQIEVDSLVIFQAFRFRG